MSLLHGILATLLALPSLWPHAPAPQDPEPHAIARALDTWLDSYHGGQLDLLSQDDVATKTVLALIPNAPRPASLDRRAELEALLRLARRPPSLTLAKPLLRLAAVGLDDRSRDYHVRMAPHVVRALAEEALHAHDSTSVKAWLLDMASAGGAYGGGASVTGANRYPASGRSSGSAGSNEEPALRAAALRALADHGDAIFRLPAERALAAKEPVVRLAAAEALYRLARAPTLDVLVTALRTESHRAVVQALARAMRHVVAEHLAELDARSLHRAVQEAIATLGRTGWQADLVLVEFLGSFRTVAAIPALIEVLERCNQGGAGGRASSSSPAAPSPHLRDAAHRALKRLTGAIYAAEDARAWRDFWERERSTFRLASSEPEQSGSTSANGFFGIPVRGGRVVFVIDVSRSMSWNATERHTTSRGVRNATRLDLAKRELCAAVEALPNDAMFNLVLFATTVRKWKPHLVQATPSRKRALVDYVSRLQADGATNLWGGVREALQIDSLVVGDVYATAVDELFVLSDGAPTAGEIVDPDVILRVVTETNRFSHVHINCVFLGEAAEAHLMQQMAAQNGGLFVRP